MNRPTYELSIIMPTFNNGSALLRAVASVYAAELPSFELLIVDDGSTDDSLHRLAQRHVNAVVTEQLKILRLPHGGAGAARNLGLLTARGTYVMFIDADDCLLPETDLTPEFLAPTADLIIYSQVATPQTVNKQRLMLADLGLPPAPVPFDSRPTSKLYRRDFLLAQQLRFPVGVKIGEDLVFNYQVLQRANQIDWSPRSIYEWHRNPASLTHQVNGAELCRDSLRLVDTMAPLLTSSPQLWQRFVFKRYLMVLVGLAKSDLASRQLARQLRQFKVQLLHRLPPDASPRRVTAVASSGRQRVLNWTWAYPGLVYAELPGLRWYFWHHAEATRQVI